MATPPNAPPKPGTRRPPPAPSTRRAALGISSEQQALLAGEALGLLSEQVESRIVHYRADLETNAELDAITAQVVAQLKAMQAAVRDNPAVQRTPEALEAEQIRVLSGLLRRLLGKNNLGEFTTQLLRPIGRRIAKLFFESELHEKTKADKERCIRLPEQGVYYVLSRYRHRIRAELDGFEYADGEVKSSTLELLEKLEHDLKTAFLSRRSRELHRVMTVLTCVLTDFFEQVLLANAEDFARSVVTGAGTSTHPTSVGYRVGSTAFQDFRDACQRQLMQRLVAHMSVDLVERLTAAEEPFLEETIAFFTTPRVYAETVDVLCDALYDHLHQQGFLDLPLDWRVQHTAQGAT
jgi:hypothetical protein